MSFPRDWAANLTLAAWCVADIVRWWPHLNLEYGVLSFAFLLCLLLSFVLMAVFALTRPAATRIDNSPRTWLLVALSVILPMSYEYLPSPSRDLASDLVRLASGVLLLGSILSLRTRFALLPADRGVTSAGPYKLVRHPIYVSYLLADLTAWLPEANPWGAGIWISEVVLFYYRARCEERLLLDDSAYSRYTRNVRYRFLPGVI